MRAPEIRCAHPVAQNCWGALASVNGPPTRVSSRKSAAMVNARIEQWLPQREPACNGRYAGEMVGTEPSHIAEAG
jgi:hypothetical protein